MLSAQGQLSDNSPFGTILATTNRQSFSLHHFSLLRSSISYWHYIHWLKHVFVGSVGWRKSRLLRDATFNFQLNIDTFTGTIGGEVFLVCTHNITQIFRTAPTLPLFHHVRLSRHRRWQFKRQKWKTFESVQLVAGGNTLEMQCIGKHSG